MATPAGRWRVAVVSGDGFNDDAGRVFAVPIMRRPSGDLPPFTAALSDPDPVGGVALIAELAQVPVEWGSERIGMLTGQSVMGIQAAMTELFEL